MPTISARYVRQRRPQKLLSETGSGGHQSFIRQGNILQKAIPAENQEGPEKWTYGAVYREGTDTYRGTFVQWKENHSFFGRKIQGCHRGAGSKETLRRPVVRWVRNCKKEIKWQKLVKQELI